MKHAYLIMVHKNSYILEKLLLLLDNSLNDLFIHVDLKCNNFNYDYYKNLLKESDLYYTTERINTRWGGYSQVKTELVIMQEAIKHGPYLYYHLISGQDMPLMSQQEIHWFCDKNYGKQYLNYIPIDMNFDFGRKLYHRASVKHYLQEYRNKFKIQTINKLITLLDRCLIAVQLYIFRIDLIKKKNINIGCGANWFSLTDDCMRYVLSQQNKIYEYFHNSSFCDELFVQTIVKASKYYHSVVPNKRYVDFGRGVAHGHPYIWQECDFKELTECGSFFARKFDEKVDKRIIDKLFKFVMEKSNKNVESVSNIRC